MTEKNIKSCSFHFIALGMSVLITFLYLVFFYSRADKPKNIPLKVQRVGAKRTVEKGKEFSIYTTLWTQVLKSGFTYSLQGEVIRGNCYIEAINFLSNANDLKDFQIKSNPLSEKEFIKKGNKGILEFNVKHQVYIPNIEFVCIARSSGEIAPAIKFRLTKTGIQKNFLFIAFQAGILIIISFLLMETFIAVIRVFLVRFGIISSRKSLDMFSMLNGNLALKTLLTLIFVFDLIFLFTYLGFFKEIIFKEFKILITTNILLFFIAAAVFMLFKQGNKAAAFILVLLIILTSSFAFIPRITADAVLWERTLKNNILWNSEIISQLINYFFYNFLNLKNFNQVFLLTSKIMGLLFIGALFFLNREIFPDRQKKAFFFSAALTGTYMIFFPGFPEYAYWAVPVQLTSLLLLIKYIKAPQWKYLFWMSVSLGLGIYLHGSIVFIIPALLIFLFLKYEENSTNTILFFLRFISPIILILILFRILASLLGYHIIFESPLREMFVVFNPDHGFIKSQMIFMEPDHLKLTGFILFLSLPSFIFLYPWLMLKKKLKLNRSAQIIFLLALFQLIPVIFLNFDYYIRDFDLFLANTVFTILLLYHLFADNIKSGLSYHLFLLFLLSVLSGIGLMALFTADKFLFLFPLLSG